MTTKDYVDNFGKPPTSPWVSGEQSHTTASVITGTFEERGFTESTGETYSEPNTVLPENNRDTVVFHSKSGGTSLVMNDPGSSGDGYMLITHKSGSVVQIDEDGTVFIKAMGDSHDNTRGHHHKRAQGNYNMRTGGEWNVLVDGGNGNINIQGDMNVECNNFNVTARGKVRFNSAEAIEFKGAKLALESHTENFDLVAKNIKLTATETASITSKDATYLSGDGTLSSRFVGDTVIQSETVTTIGNTNNQMQSGGTVKIKSGGETIIGADSELKMSGSVSKIFGSTVHIDDLVNLAMGGASQNSVDSVEDVDFGFLASVPTMPAPSSKRASSASTIPVKGGMATNREVKG